MGLSPAYDIISSGRAEDHALSLLGSDAPKDIAANLDEFAHMLELDMERAKAWTRQSLSYLEGRSIPLVAAAHQEVRQWAHEAAG